MTTLKRVQFQEEASEQEKEELVAETILNAMQNYFFYRLQNPGVMLYAVTGKEPAGVPHMNGFFNFKKNLVYDNNYTVIGERKKDHFLRIYEPNESESIRDLYNRLTSTFAKSAYKLEQEETRVVCKLKAVQIQAFEGLSNQNRKLLFVFDDPYVSFDDRIQCRARNAEFVWEPYKGTQGFLANLTKVQDAFLTIGAATTLKNESERIRAIKDFLLFSQIKVPFQSITIGSVYGTPAVVWQLASGTNEDKFRAIFAVSRKKDLRALDYAVDHSLESEEIVSLQDVWPHFLRKGSFEAFIENLAEFLSLQADKKNSLKTALQTNQRAILTRFKKHSRPDKEVSARSKDRDLDFCVMEARVLELGNLWEQRCDEERRKRIIIENRLRERTAEQEKIAERLLKDEEAQKQKEQARLEKQRRAKPRSTKIDDDDKDEGDDEDEDEDKGEDKDKEVQLHDEKAALDYEKEKEARIQAGILGSANNKLDALTECSLRKARQALLRVLPMAEIVLPSEWKARREKPIDNIVVVPYGSYFYSHHPGDLDAYCILPFTQTMFDNEYKKLKRVLDPSRFVVKQEYCTLNQQENITLIVDGLEVEIHYVPNDPFFLKTLVTPAAELHTYVVAEMHNRATISMHYDALKEWCKQKRIYASRYGLTRGILLALLAVQWRDKVKLSRENFEITVLTDHKDVIVSFLKGVQVDTDSPYEIGPGIIKKGDCEVVLIEGKRVLGMLRYLEAKNSQPNYVKSEIDYNDTKTVRKLIKAMEKDANITYFVPLPEGSKLVFFTDGKQLPDTDQPRAR